LQIGNTANVKTCSGFIRFALQAAFIKPIIQGITPPSPQLAEEASDDQDRG